MDHLLKTLSMRCREFLELYSDFRDGLITDHRRRRRFARHALTCVECGGYDASVREGVRALRLGAGEIEPSPGFRDRLLARLAAGAEPQPLTPAAASIAVMLMLAAALALIIHEGASRAAAPTPPPVQATAPQPRPMVVVNPGVPFVTFTDLSVPAFQSNVTHSPTDVAPGSWASLPR